MIVNQQVLATLNTGFSAAFNKGFAGVAPRYARIATTIPSSTSEQKYAWIGNFPKMKKWIGEREIQSMSAYDYVIKNEKFEATVSVKRDDIEDDQYGMYGAIVTALGQEAAKNPDDLVFKAVRKGFEQLCYDGKPFFSENHKNGEYTYSNKSTAKLSQESYAAARTAMMGVLGENGDSLGIVPDLLLVSPANEEKALMILKADYINGTTNVYKGTAELLVVPELASVPNAWYLLCTSMFLKPFIYQERKKIKFVSLTKDTDTNVFMKDEYIYGADGRCNVGYGFPQMAYGSTGEAQG